jgi:hypothetical protein
MSAVHKVKVTERMGWREVKCRVCAGQNAPKQDTWSRLAPSPNVLLEGRPIA